MTLRASLPLKVVYVFVVLAAIVPIGLASSSWVGLATGRSARSLLWLVALLALGIYRIVLVVRHRDTLDSPEVRGVALLLRWAGIFCLFAGAVGWVVNLVARPLLHSMMTSRSDSGIEFFIVGLFLAILGGLGWSGLLAFEFSRLLGFERQARQGP
jgi:hypothetical protein